LILGFKKSQELPFAKKDEKRECLYKKPESVDVQSK
jgi:hypothetical protein